MAVKNRADLISQSDSTFQDSPIGNITPPNHREFNNDSIDSFANLNDINQFLGVNDFNGITNCANLFNTSMDNKAFGNVVDLGDVVGNFVAISGGGVGEYLGEFGMDLQQGSWRMLRFDTSGGTIEHNYEKIICPNNENIIVEAGDTALVIYEGVVSNKSWIVHTYQRFSGLPLNGTPFPYSYSPSIPPPDVNSDSTQGKEIGYRYITKDETNKIFRELICTDNAVGSAIWLPNGGTFGIIGGGFDFEVLSMTITPNAGGPTTNATDYNLRYQIIGDMFLLSGEILFDNITIDNSHPKAEVLINWTNNYNLLLAVGTANGAVGFGVVDVNNAVPPSGYICYVDNTSDSTSLKIQIETENPHFGNNHSIKVQFNASCFFKIDI